MARSGEGRLLVGARRDYLFRRGRQRLAFLDDVGGQDLSAASAGVGRVMDRTRGDDESLSGLQRDRRLPILLVQERALEDVADFFTGMRMAPRRRARLEIGDRLDDFPAGRREIGLLDDGPLERGRLRAECDDEGGY